MAQLIAALFEADGLQGVGRVLGIESQVLGFRGLGFSIVFRVFSLGLGVPIALYAPWFLSEFVAGSTILPAA